MPRSRRPIRKDGEDTPISGTPSAPPPSSSSGTGNPYTKWFIGVAAFLLAIIGVPALMWAQTDSTVKVNPLQVQQIQDKLVDMQNQVRGLVTPAAAPVNQVSNTCTSGGCQSCRSDKTRNKCLNQCVWNTSNGIMACVANVFAQSKASSSTYESTLPTDIFDATGITSATDLNQPTFASCFKSGNSCFTGCDNTLSCEDRAMAWFGACQAWVTTYVKDPTKQANWLAMCGKIDRQLVLTYCGKQGLKEADLSSDFCSDQCCRVESVCNSAMLSYSNAQQAVCKSFGEKCRTQACPGAQQTSCTDAQLAVCNTNLQAGPHYAVGNGVVYAYQSQYDTCKQTCSWPTVSSCTADQVKACNDSFNKYAEAGDPNLSVDFNVCLRSCQWPTTGQTPTQTSCTQELQSACKSWNDYCMATAKSQDKCKSVYTACQASCTTCSYDQLKACYTKFDQEKTSSAAAAATNVYNPDTFKNCAAQCHPTGTVANPQTQNSQGLTQFTGGQ